MLTCVEIDDKKNIIRIKLGELVVSRDKLKGSFQFFSLNVNHLLAKKK